MSLRQKPVFSTIGDFLARKNVRITPKRYFVDAMSAMAMGLFASLLMGTILSKIAELTAFAWLHQAASYASSASGAAMAVAIGTALQAPGLVLFTLCGVGMGANAAGGPLATLFSAIFACEMGKLVSRETKIDILITPAVTLLSGLMLCALIGPAVGAAMTGFGNVIMRSTALAPFWMGMLVSALVGIALTLPISSAAICSALMLTGLAGGAATAGCCAQMIGFAVMSYQENGVSGLVAQGLGTSMLQMGNIVRNPRVWIPPILASLITGPIATCVFGMKNGVAIASGMGTCGLVGPIGVISSIGFGSGFDWLGLVSVCFVLPAVITWIFGLILRKIGWIKPGDLRLEL